MSEKHKIGTDALLSTGWTIQRFVPIDGKYHHVGLTVEVGKSHKIYVDGELAFGEEVNDE
jgi:hypothetical protein